MAGHKVRINGVWVSVLSSTPGGGTAATAPSAPRSVTATSADSSVDVTWIAPLSTGGSALTGYNIIASPLSATAIVEDDDTAGTVTAWKWTLAAGWVRNNTAGDTYCPSANQAATLRVTTFAGGVVKIYGTKDLHHSIATVTVDGGTAVDVDGYASSRLDKALLWTSPALSAGTHTIVLTTTSRANALQTPSGVMYVLDRAEVTNANTGAGSATNVTKSVAAGVTSTTVTGLTNGTAYSVGVSAVNAVGTSQVETMSGTVTPAATTSGVPGAPTNVVASAGDTQATLTWAAPANTGSSSITSYTVISNGIATTDNNDTAGTVTAWKWTYSAGWYLDSTVGTHYCPNPNETATLRVTTYANGIVRLYGIKDAHHSIATVSVDGGTAQDVDFYASARTTNALLWTSPALSAGTHTIVLTTTTRGNASQSPGGTGVMVVLDYAQTVNANTGAGQTSNVVAAPATSTTITGLTNGTSYTFNVAATNGTGTGAYSVNSNTIIPLTPNVGGGGSGWLSGAGDDTTANITGGGFGNWRGSTATFARIWADASIANMQQMWMLDNYSSSGWNGTLDIACGGPRDGYTWASAASGAMDALWRQQCQLIHAKWSNLRQVHLSMAHELNGTWYPWSVDSSEVANFKTAWSRWYNIVQQELVAKGRNAKVALCFNSDNVNGVPVSTLMPPLAQVDILAVDFYSAYPDLPNLTVWNAGLNSTKADGSPRGIGSWQSYATSIGKPITFPEWGTNPHNTTDNPFFIEQMRNWFAANAPANTNSPGAGKVAGEAYFNTWTQCRLYPNTAISGSSNKYKSLSWGS